MLVYAGVLWLVRLGTGSWATFAAVLLVSRWLLCKWQENRHLPPGPWGLPVAGYLAFLKSNRIHQEYGALAAKYGPMFSARFGSQLMVVLSDYRIIRDAFRREELTSRPETPLMSIIEGYGIINSTGDLWKEQRRFLMEKLRLFGMNYMGKNSQKLENRITTEVDSLLSMLHATKGSPVDLSSMIALSVSNVICNIVMSVRFKGDDPRFIHFTNLIEEGMKLFGQVCTIEYIPTWQYLPGIHAVKNKIMANKECMFQFYQEVIDDHKKTFDPNNIRDLVDMYLVEIQKAKDEGRDGHLFDGKDHEQQIKQIIADLFTAGMETIKSTLLWMIIHMLRNPEAFKKVQEELDQVVGRERLPRIDDMKYLPVTETTIMESLRISTVVPLATTHSPTRDMTLNGYTIPAGAQVIPSIYSVHMDPQLWDRPHLFMPERFIDASTGRVRAPECYMPFGVGRRMCLGHVMARKELFLFFTALAHTFDVRLPEGARAPSLEGIVGATLLPDAYEVVLTPRPFGKAAEQLPHPLLEQQLLQQQELQQHQEQLEQQQQQQAAATLLRNVGSH